MTTDAVANDEVIIPDAPDIPGLSFRRFRGESDFPKLVAVLDGSKEADGIDEVDTVDGMSRAYATLKNSDPYKDVLIAEVEGQIIAYSRVEWEIDLDGNYLYFHLGSMLPEWRGKGIEQVMMRESERRLCEIAAGHPNAPRLFEYWVRGTQTWLAKVVEDEGYQPVRYDYAMVRPDLENIPDCPFPPNVETRPVTPEQYRTIWDAEVEAFKDHWGMVEQDERDFQIWLIDSDFNVFQPELWQVAWDGDQVVGMVRNFINHKENEKFNRKRGYTEYISVRRPWRKKGVAKALIARSFQTLKDQGMTEAALGVDTENPNGALQLYESMGFQVTRRDVTYRKPMDS